jgi:ParB family chromosome partitioning protein
MSAEITYIPIKLLKPNPWNCNCMSKSKFKALVKSMAKSGNTNIQPLVVRQLRSGEYEIIDGEHRFYAAKEIGWEKLPAIVKELDDEQAKIMTVKLNYVRGKMNPIRLFELLYNDWEGGKGNLTTRELEEKYENLFDQSWIARILQLRNLAPKVKEEVERAYNSDDVFLPGLKHLLIISQLRSEEEQLRFLKACISTGVSVHTLEKMVKEYLIANKNIDDVKKLGKCIQSIQTLPEGLENLNKRRRKTTKIKNNETMFKCVNCDTCYKVNWRRRTIAKLVVESNAIRAMYVVN